MSIERTQATNPVNAIAATQEMRTRLAEQNASKEQDNVANDSRTQVTLSTLTQQIKTDSSRDIDYERVASIRAALEAGELPLKPEKIARAMVQDIVDFN